MSKQIFSLLPFLSGLCAVVCHAQDVLVPSAEVPPPSGDVAKTVVVFSEDFESQPAGALLAKLKPSVGEAYAPNSVSRVVIGEQDGLPAASKTGGKQFAKLTPGSDGLRLTPQQQADLRKQSVRLTFEIRIPKGDGTRGADIQSFLGAVPEGRAFNLLLHDDGQIHYYAGGHRAVAGRLPTDQWVSVEIVADYSRHVFRATIGKTVFVGRFDTATDSLSQIYFGEFGDPTFFYDNVRLEIVPGLAGSIPIPIDGHEPLAPPGLAFDVGRRAQLFIDRQLVHDSDRVAFTLHQGRTHAQNPLLKPDQPWEGWRLEIFGSVIYDEEDRLFKMWYIGESPEDFPDYATMYATSQDGIKWEKPLIGTVKSARGTVTNAVAEGYMLASVIKDKADPDPNRRYKMICWRQKQPHGAQSMTSPDGLNWKQVGDKPICRSSDVITGYYDAARRMYVAFPKLNTAVRGLERRCFGVSLSRDFLTWSEPELAFVPDARDDAGSLARIERVRHILDRPDDPQFMRTEFYGIGLYPHESCTIAFPWVLTVNNNARYGNHEGPAEIQLAVSRNLRDWERPFRTPVIPINRRGAWDESYQQTAASAIRVGDEIRLYYCGANYTHGTPVLYRTQFEDGRSTGRKTKYTGGIGLVTWPLDRFVSVDGSLEGGTLTTVPLTHSGERLEINADVKTGGELIVELLDAAGNPLNDWERSAPVVGDNLRHTVTFSGSTDVSRLAGKPIVLRFHLKSADLYSFAFRN